MYRETVAALLMDKTVNLKHARPIIALLYLTCVDRRYAKRLVRVSFRIPS